MKKKILFILVATMMITSLTACGKKNKDKKEEEPAQTEQVEEASKEEPKAEPKQEDKANDSKALYVAFMNGEEPVYCDKYIDNYKDYYNTEYSHLTFESNKPYMLPEFVEAIVEHLEIAEYGNYSLDEVQFAYIDCGMDGIPELALRFPDIESWGTNMICIVVLKEIDGKLQLCFEQNCGYRCFTEINSNGYVRYDGSNGAASHYYKNSMIDANGDEQLLYELDTTYGVYNMYFPDMVEGPLHAEALGIANTIMFYGYSFDSMLNRGEDYDEIVRNRKYTYYRVTENYNEVNDSSIYTDKDNPYYDFVHQTNLDIATPDEIDKIIADRKKSIGLTDEIENGTRPRWTTFYYAGIYEEENIEEEDYEHNAVYVQVANPSWEYYSAVDYDPSNLPVVLTQTSKKANDIIDDEDWLNSIGEEGYNPSYCHDDIFDYYLSGITEYEPYIINIYNRETGYHVAQLDMSEFVTPPTIAAGDEMFVSEAVRYVQYDDGILYVAMNHSTYSSSAPQNAYIIALDTYNNYQVIWKSQPLVSNAYNFAIIDNTIICGYGFTAEKDYIYLLDKHSGVQMDIYPVKTGPDYFFIKDGTLYVRTYDTNYEYQISFG